MPRPTRSLRRPSPGERWGVHQNRDNDSPQTNGALDRIPQLMHELHNKRRAGSGGFTPSYPDQFLTQHERQRDSDEAASSSAAGSPTHRDPPYDIGEYMVSTAAPPAPPPRALELVKEEVHRALEAFSTRPLKGQPKAPLPSDLLRPFDVSKDGLVTYREFRTGILGLGVGLTAQEAEALARTVDGEGTGLVDRGKFEAEMTQDWRHSGDCDKTTSAAELAKVSSTGLDGAMRDDQDALGWQNGGANQQLSFSRPEEEQHEATRQPKSNGGDSCTRDRQIRFFSGEELPPQPPQSSKKSHPVGPDSTPETTPNNSRVGVPPVVSFDHWQRHRMAARKGEGSKNGSDVAAASTSIPGGSNASTNTKNTSKGRGEKPRNVKITNNGNNLHPSLKHLGSLNTLRSLLRQDGVFGDKAAATSDVPNDNTCYPSPCDSGSGNRESRDNRQQEQIQDQHQHQQQHHSFRVDAVDFRPSGCNDGGGDCRRREDSRLAVRDNLLQVLRRDASASFLTPRGASTGSNVGGRRRGSDWTGTSNAIPTAKVHTNLERGRAIAARAESILRMRSRGDLVGLRRAVSKADPSASGVVSQREMERVVLRRFGAGLGDDEARELAARYRRDFNGRSMVDYGRLFDSLEAKEAGLFGRAMPLPSSPSSYSGRGRGWGRRREGQQQQQRLSSRNSEGRRRARPASMEVIRGSRRRTSSSMPAAAGARNRYSQRRYSRRGVPTCDSYDDGWIGGNIAGEESQLVRRARAKTLALLDHHGTRSFDSIFRLVDPGHTQSVTSEKLRKGLRMLGGTDPLSEVEHRALFRDISKGRDRIKYKELLDTLRTAEAVENRERTERKLAHQAELPTSGRGSASHWRHSDVLDWDVPPAGSGGREDACDVGLTGGRQHKESRRQALVFDKLRNTVRQIQEQRDSAGPVLNMFYQHGRSGGTDVGATTSPPESNDKTSERDDHHNPPALSPSALRAGLGSLGVPLGDEDFVALIATTDPDRRGEVSYPTFCEALDLHELRGNLLDGDRFDSSTKRGRPGSVPPPPPPSLRQYKGQYAEGGAVNTAAGAGSREGGGGGYARRRAMELAPPADPQKDLEGGVFHVNPATEGCANPTFTTTMMSTSGRGRGGAHQSTVEAYRPKRRQSPAPAPGGVLTGVRAKSHGQTLLVVGDGGDRVELRSETGAEAERQFRQGLGVKMRRSQSLSSCYAYGRRGWDNLGTPSPRGIAPPPPPPSASAAVETGTAWSGNGNTDTHAFTGGNGNRRSRCHTPRDNDLGFGSERMRSRSRCRNDQDRCNRGRRRCGEADDGRSTNAGLRRVRSLSLGAERRYGDWARSSVKHLLQQDSWLGIRSSHLAAAKLPATHHSNKTEHPLSGVGSGGAVNRQARRVPAEARHKANRCRSSPQGVSHRSAYCGTRHPAQTRERRPTPYATDADYGSVRRVMPVEVEPARSAASRAPRVARRGQKGAGRAGGSGGGGGGELSPTLRWGETTSFPQKQSSGRESVTRGHAAVSSGLKKSRSRR